MAKKKTTTARVKLKKTGKKAVSKKVAVKKRPSKKLNAKEKVSKIRTSVQKNGSKIKKVTMEKTMTAPEKTSAVSDAMLGKTVSNFKCLDSKGNAFELANQKGKKTVFYFYPKDDTPGCTIEGKEFSELHQEFKKYNTDVFGISRDSVKSHDKFKCKYNFNFELLSDENENICKIFDVIKQKNMYGKMVMGIERSTFILDENLKVIYAERKVKAEGHAANILAQVR